ncbi:MAG: hypothetical protein ACYCXF_04825 [Thermoleophilia bacterium]
MNSLSLKITLACLALLSGASAVTLMAGCNGTPPQVMTATATVPGTSTAPPYQRREVTFYKGIDEPQASDWQVMIDDSSRLQADGFNTVTLSPPVDFTARTGDMARTAYEGAATAAKRLMYDFHARGLAVYISPTTTIAGLGPAVDPTTATLQRLQSDTLDWAVSAEAGQAELFSPLTDFNLALGTTAAANWSINVLPLVREKYHGPVAARVVADLSTPSPAGQPHDFEFLDYGGYDYLMIDIFPRGDVYDPVAFDGYVINILDRAAAVARRDELKGVMVSFGAWREAAGVDTVNGPLLGGTAQAELAAHFLEIAQPRTRGIFFQGWTLPGRGARGNPVEETLKQFFTR